MIYRFWLEHADAVGAALIVFALAIVALWRVIRRYERLAAGQRAVFRARLDAQRRELREQYRPLITALARRQPTYDEQVTQAIGHTRPGPVRTPLTDAYALERTVADVPSPYVPAFYDGSAR